MAASGVACTILAWLGRRHWNRGDVLAILMGLTFVFVGYSHDYDYVGLIPLWAALWVYGRRGNGVGMIAAGLTLLLFVPERLVSRRTARCWTSGEQASSFSCSS